jgi:hypothetical protein
LIRIFLSVVLFLVIGIGCLPVTPAPVVSTEPPVAYIDSVSATTAAQGQTVTFSGHGTELNGTVVAYSWRSDRDGDINKTANFSTSSLSVGNHYIYFKVQNNKGIWSREVVAILNIVPAGMVKPDIVSFKATPELIFAGQSTTLTWKVTEALTITITPDIGDVPLSGSRLITPPNNTVYTMTATNKAGTISESVRVTVNQETTKTVELFSIPSDEGYVDRNGAIGNVARVGVSESGVASQGFLSYDISMIPYGATILSVTLDLQPGVISGSPWGLLGGMGIFLDQYSMPLTAGDYKTSFTQDAMLVTYNAPTQAYIYPTFINAVQKLVDSKNPRFKIRIQFEKFTYNVSPGFSQDGSRLSNPQPNVMEFGKGKTKLIVTYK